MFKEIKYIDRFINNLEEDGNLYYKVIHLDFEFKIRVQDVPSLTFIQHSALILKTIFTEYDNMGLSYNEAINNLFKCNLYLCERYSFSFEDLLSIQNNEIYFFDLRKLFEKYKLFI